jgi:hypothetical protein
MRNQINWFLSGCGTTGYGTTGYGTTGCGPMDLRIAGASSFVGVWLTGLTVIVN